LNESNSSTIIYNKLDPHTNTNENTIILEPLKNGFITICHIILPKVNIDNYNPMDYIEKYVKVKNYIKKVQINALFGESGEDEESNLDDDDDSEDDYISGGYFTDGVKIYFKNIKGETRIVELQELVEVNPLAFGILKFT
jgi:hypothetical protein